MTVLKVLPLAGSSEEAINPAKEDGNLAGVKAGTDKIPTQGQALMAASTPVAIASNQSAIPTMTQSAVLTFYTAAVKTASENSASQASSAYRDALLEVDITAVSGTSPTLIIAVETSEDNVTWFHNTVLSDKERQGSLTRLTAPTDEAKITTVSKHVAWLRDLSAYIRLALTIGGTLPSFTITAKVTPYG